MEELVLWLDASNIDGRYNKSLNDGDKVAEWIDLSGKGHHVSQSVSTYFLNSLLMNKIIMV